MLSLFKANINSKSIYERNSYLFTLEGIIGAIILNLTNPFFSMFAKRMGAGDYHIGLLSSLPALVGILALIPGALIVDRQKDKKKIVGYLILFYGLMYSLGALTPYLGQFRVIVYIVVIALLNWPYSVYNISWQSFFSDVFTPGSRNLAYTKRGKYAMLFGMITFLMGGLILSYIPQTDWERIIVYQIFFIASFGLSIVQKCFLFNVDGYSIPEKRITSKPGEALSLSFKFLVHSKQFRSFVIISFLFHISWQMSWPLFFIYQVDYLHANEAWISYINVANGLAGVLTFSFWNRMIDRKGGRFVVIIGALGLAINPFLTVMSKSLIMLLLVNILTGLLFPAFQLAIFDNLLEVVPRENKTLNIALYTTLTSVSNFIAPLIGVAIYKHTSIVFAMVLDGCLRLFASGLFLLRCRPGSRDYGSDISA